MDVDSVVVLPTPCGRDAADRDNDLAVVAGLDLVPYVGGRVCNRIDRRQAVGFGRVGARQQKVVANHLGDVFEARVSAQSAVIGTVLSAAIGGRTQRAEQSIQHALRHISFRNARAGVIDQGLQPGHSDGGIDGHGVRISR